MTEIFKATEGKKWMLESLKLAYILFLTRIEQWLFDTSK